MRLTGNLLSSYRLSLGMLIMLTAQSCAVDNRETVDRDGEKRIKFYRDDIKSTTELIAQPILPNLKIEKVRSMLFREGRLIIADANPSSMIRIIDSDSRKIISVKGVHGYGPGEIMAPSTIESDLNDPDVIWSFSINQKLWSKFDINSESRLAIAQRKMVKDMLYVSTPRWTSKETILGVNFNGKAKFTEFDSTGVMIKEHGDWAASYEKKIPENVIGSMLQGQFRTDHRHEKFIRSGLYVDHLEILDITNNQFTIIDGPDHIKPSFKILQVRGSPVFSPNKAKSAYAYVDAFIGKQKYYGLYSGKYWNGSQAGKNQCTEIVVIDQSDHSVELFKLDLSITRFTVDEENRIVYGVTYEENPRIVKYEF